MSQTIGQTIEGLTSVVKDGQGLNIPKQVYEAGAASAIAMVLDRLISIGKVPNPRKDIMLLALEMEAYLTEYLGEAP